MDILEKTLLSIAGKIFSKPDFEEDLDKILSRGKSVNIKNIETMKGRDSQCHENTALCWDNNRDICSIMTGYALYKGMWVQHSWVLKKTGVIVETTFPRDSYFGFKLTHEEAEEFYNNNAW
jgi:hypothetical protein